MEGSGWLRREGWRWRAGWKTGDCGQRSNEQTGGNQCRPPGWPRDRGERNPGGSPLPRANRKDETIWEEVASNYLENCTSSRLKLQRVPVSALETVPSPSRVWSVHARIARWHDNPGSFAHIQNEKQWNRSLKKQLCLKVLLCKTNETKKNELLVLFKMEASRV